MYFVIVLIVFIGTTGYYLYNEKYPDNSFLDTESVYSIALLTVITFVAAFVWPVSILCGLLVGLTYLILIAVHKLKAHNNAKAN